MVDLKALAIRAYLKDKNQNCFHADDEALSNTLCSSSKPVGYYPAEKKSILTRTACDCCYMHNIKTEYLPSVPVSDLLDAENSQKKYQLTKRSIPLLYGSRT